MRRMAVVLAVVVGAGVSVLAGTELSISFGTPEVTCPDGAVAVPYTISATSADAASVTEKLSNGSVTVAERAYTIASGASGWTVAGRTKTFDGLFQKTGLADGTYSLEICVTQAGSGGNPGKHGCQTIPIVVACAEAWNPCASAAPFGEVVGNDRIRPNATAQIQFRGNFGELASVVITGPEGFYRTGWVARAGDSCNYHANWKFMNDSGADFLGNHGEGIYTVTVTGNGSEPLQFPVSLKS